MASHETALAAGVTGIAFSLQGTPGASVAVDYRKFADGFGGRFGARLRLVSLPACALTTPQRLQCREQTALASSNDVAAQRVSAVIADDAATGDEPLVVGVTSDSGGSDGAFTATSLAPTGKWTVSGSTGGFGWSYPLTAPPAATGTAPTVALGYSSSTVDGRVASTNNQTSWLGSGWNYQPGFIERSYRPCIQDPEATAASKTGDLCWAGQVVTMQLGGSSVRLVRDDASGTWRPERDGGEKVELLTGAANGVNNGEHWRITTADGTQYYFGLDRPPGWDSSITETNSAWTVPVYAAHAGEPCYNAAGFSQSRCDQAWRWNLDYTVDLHGNATVYRYQTEQNYYGAALGSTPIGYTRAGNLRSIDYGLRLTGGSVFGASAPQQIVFGVRERCLPTSTFACDPNQFTAANAARWPDTPQDLACASTGSCATHSPTFWTSRRLGAIETKVLDGSTYQVVNRYDLVHAFPSGAQPEMTLTSIIRTGSNTAPSIELPPVQFGYIALDNRVQGFNSTGAMQFRRLNRITSETGAITTVTYGQPARTDTGAATACTATTVPTNPAANTTLCFPVKWVLPLHTDSTLDWFHKYVVTKISTQSIATPGNSPTQLTSYRYLGAPAWRADDNELVKPADRSYGQYRGFGAVEIRDGDPTNSSNGLADAQTLTTTQYLRGLGSTVTNSLGESVDDDDQYAGVAFDSRTYNGSGGSLLSTTLTETNTLATTASQSRDGLPAVTSRIVRPTRVRTITENVDGTERTATTATRYDSRGRSVARSDSGTSVAATCTTASYADNPSLNLYELTDEQSTWAGACPATGTPTGTPLSAARTYYDGATTLGNQPTKGDPTSTLTALDAPGGVIRWSTTTATYDAAGRTRTTTSYPSGTSAAGRTTTTAYTPAAGGPLTKVTITNALGQITTTETDPGTGTPTAATDVATLRTTATYDALGRLTAVWEPGHVQGTDSASTLYSYSLDNTTTPLCVVTKKLVDIGPSETYVTSVAILDSLGRTVQTQADAEGTAGGRTVTDTYYDSHGWTIRSNNRWYTTGVPSRTQIIASGGINNIDSRSTYRYDGVGRRSWQHDWQGATRTDVTNTLYGGDRTTVIPTDGGTTTATLTDVHGNTTQTWLYTSDPTIQTGGIVAGGTRRVTNYAYDALGQLAGMTDASGATWAYTHDLAGRTTSQDDPDAGNTFTTYLDTGEPRTTTDALNTTLTTTYDALGRKTGLKNGSTQLSSWTYDTLRDGKLTSSTRYTPQGNYTVAARGFDRYDNPLGTKTTIPAVETGLAGTYETQWTWSSTHLMQLEILPSGAGLPAEQLSHTYTRLGNQISNTGGFAYATNTTYSPYGEVVQIALGANDQSGSLTMGRDVQTRRTTSSQLDVQAINQRVERFDYTYNRIGDITRTVNTQGSGTTAPIQTTCYRYNTLRELTGAWSADDNCATVPTTANTTKVGGPQPFWTTWTYDTAGTRTQQVQNKVPDGRIANTVTTNYTSTNTDHPHAINSISYTGGTAALAYDAAGAVTSRTGIPGSPDQSFTYTAEHRVNTIVNDGGATTRYIYDADGKILLRTEPSGGKLLFVGDTQYVRGANGTYYSHRYYNHAGYRIADRVTTGEVYYFASDIVGTSTTSILAGQSFGTPIRRHFDPYGNPTSAGAIGNWPDRQGYLGKPYNNNTNLTELGARLYDPVTGQFLAVDPILTPYNPLQNNGYNYAANSPITNSDPNGTCYQNYATGNYVGVGCGGGSTSASVTTESQDSYTGRWITSTEDNNGDQDRAAVDTMLAKAGQAPRYAGATGTTWLKNVLTGVAGAVVGTVAALGCTGVTLGWGAVGCAAAGGALGGAVTSGLNGDSPSEVAESAAWGGGLGLAGGALAVGVRAASKFISSGARASQTADRSLVRLYRAVEPDELHDIVNTGVYRSIPGGVEGKYFFPTRAQAQNFGNLMEKIGTGPYCISSGCIPSSLLSGVERLNISGEGPAYMVPNGLLPYFESIVANGG